MKRRKRKPVAPITLTQSQLREAQLRAYSTTLVFKDDGLFVEETGAFVAPRMTPEERRALTAGLHESFNDRFDRMMFEALTKPCSTTAATVGAPKSIDMRGLDQVVKMLGEHKAPPAPFPGDFLPTLPRPDVLGGLPLFIAEPRTVPVIELSERCPVSDGFRAEMNAWLAETFGYRDASMVPLGTSYVLGGNRGVVMRREDVMRLGAHLAVA